MLGPEASAVMKGRFTSVEAALDSSILAFSAASSGAAAPGGRCAGRCRFLFEFISQEVDHALVEIFAAQESVAIGDFTSNTPSRDFQHETSKVPPPRS